MFLKIELGLRPFPFGTINHHHFSWMFQLLVIFWFWPSFQFWEACVCFFYLHCVVKHDLKLYYLNFSTTARFCNVITSPFFCLELFTTHRCAPGSLTRCISRIWIYDILVMHFSLSVDAAGELSVMKHAISYFLLLYIIYMYEQYHSM